MALARFNHDRGDQGHRAGRQSVFAAWTVRCTHHLGEGVDAADVPAALRDGREGHDVVDVQVQLLVDVLHQRLDVT